MILERTNKQIRSNIQAQQVAAAHRGCSRDGDLLYELVEHSLFRQSTDVKSCLIRGSLAHDERVVVNKQISNIGVSVRRQSTLTLGRPVFDQ